MKENRTVSKIIEAALLIASIVVTVIPVLLCVALLDSVVSGNLREPFWKTIMIVIFAVSGIFGFYAQLLRLIEIFTRSVSPTATTGLIVGLCAYLFFIIEAFSDLKRDGWWLVYFIPLAAVFCSLKNIYTQKKLKTKM